MTSRSVLTKLAKNIPAEIRELLGKPPLVFGESPAVYYGMLASVAESIKPDNFITWTLLKDWVDSQIEVARYRKFKSQVINEPRRKEIQTKIDYWQARAVADRLATNEQINDLVVEKIAEEPGASEERIDAIDDEISAKLIAAEEAGTREAKRKVQYWKKLLIRSQTWRFRGVRGLSPLKRSMYCKLRQKNDPLTRATNFNWTCAAASFLAGTELLTQRSLRPSLLNSARHGLSRKPALSTLAGGGST